MKWIVALLAAVVLSACSSSDGGGGPAEDAGPGGDLDAGPLADSGRSWPSTVGGVRPARVVVPSSYDGTTPYPLVILLHGYTASGMLQDLYWGLSRQAREMGFLLVLPDGLVDGTGNRYWNATPACCDFGGSGVDDVAYLRGLVTEMKAEFMVDPERVYFTGHSNGGFMSYRMACEMADEVAAIGVLAGSDFPGEMDCVPSQPVSVLHVHGTVDTTVPYEGMAGAYPGAVAAAERWAMRAACDTTMAAMGSQLDLVSSLAGDDTTVTQYRSGCMAGHEVELWTIEGGSHIPGFNDTWGPSLLTWLLAHRR